MKHLRLDAQQGHTIEPLGTAVLIFIKDVDRAPPVGKVKCAALSTRPGRFVGGRLDHKDTNASEVWDEWAIQENMTEE